MVVAIGREAKRHRYQLEEIAGNTDNVIEVQSFKQLSKSLRRLREVTCSEYHHVLVLLKVSVNENFSTLLDFVFFGFLA